MPTSKPTASSKPLWVAVDTGGTFTDCVWVERGRLRIAKVFSSPTDPSQAIIEAVACAGHRGAVVLLHGTTVGTNALLERKVARVAFVTTDGFQDTIEIGRQARPKLYDLTFERTPPLVERSLRFGVPERVASTGEVLKRPSREELRLLARDVHLSNPQAIAISTLFSFANSENEEAIGRVLEELGLPLSLSHEILPEFREYERASTVVINACLQPIMQTYLTSLETRMSRSGAGARAQRIFVMQSSGGITSLQSAARQPVRTVLSGPAGGVVGASAMAQRGGFEQVITFDMGGTSTDVALVKGAPQPSNEAEVAGFPVRVPMLDIHTVGAGGGSIARFDAGGALRVGPESAGADPGPICYGRGLEPTVTDANLLLGRLRADQFLGGEFRLDLDRTRTVVRDWLKARNCKLLLEQFAAGVIRVVNANMERALRVVSIERGNDPRDFALVAFGGAGALHACELADALGIPTVIVPAIPGALSACGILVSDIVKDYSRTLVWKLRDEPPIAKLREQFAALKKLAEQDFRAEGWKGRLQFELSADLRFQGQGFELNVPFTPSLLQEFDREHRTRYGYSYSDRSFELVTIRLRARMKSGQEGRLEISGPRAGGEKVQRDSVYFQQRPTATPIIPRHSLKPGRRLQGPAVITEYSATTVVPPRARFGADNVGNLIIRIASNKKGARIERPKA